MHGQNTRRGTAISWASRLFAIVAFTSSLADGAEVWRSGSVLTITETVEVRDSLVIEPGVTAYFSETASIDVLAGGTLTIQGTAESPVRLLPLNVELAWFGVWFLPGSQGTVRHVELTGANSVSLSIIESSPLERKSGLRERSVCARARTDGPPSAAGNSP
jgi:hypothetical protein